MLRSIVLAVQIVVLLLIAYNLVIALWGWRNPAPVPTGTRTHRLRVVIPAHNEERVIGDLLADIAGQEYRDDLVEVWVLADRCTDGTVQRAQGKARIAERNDDADGKGAALSWFVERHPLDEEEVLVILDADNRLPSDLFARISDHLDAGAGVVQAYLDIANPDESILTVASAVSYWASNRMVQLARHNLGWPVDLGGTGMAITAPALADAGGFQSSLAEDQDLGVRLFRSGHSARWMHDVRIADEKPSSVGVAVRQRARWAGGRSRLGRESFRSLVGSRLPGARDLALRLIQPSRTFMALVTALLAIVAWLFPSDWLLAWPVWAVAALLQFLSPLPFLARDGVERRYLWRYPLLAVFGVLYLPVRVLGRRNRDWYHTPHEGTSLPPQ